MIDWEKIVCEGAGIRMAPRATEMVIPVHPEAPLPAVKAMARHLGMQLHVDGAKRSLRKATPVVTAKPKRWWEGPDAA